MNPANSRDYSALDRPEILSSLFFPRKETVSSSERSGRNMDIPLEDGTVLGARFHHAGKEAPTIMFFHGNGEIAADYDDIGPLFGTMGVNFMVIDYRGYGRSSGQPTVRALMTDCHEILSFSKNRLSENGYNGPLVVMGRSLGSAPALESAFSHQESFKGLIIESGFAYMMPLLRRLGIEPERLGLSEEDGCRNMEKIRNVTIPTLVIHAEHDHIIPFSDGKALYEASASRKKKLIMIPGADHNTIFVKGFGIYMKAIRDFMEAV